MYLYTYKPMFILMHIFLYNIQVRDISLSLGRVLMVIPSRLLSWMTPPGVICREGAVNGHVLIWKKRYIHICIYIYVNIYIYIDVCICTFNCIHVNLLVIYFLSLLIFSCTNAFLDSLYVIIWCRLLNND
jgi:hypothetical protein